MAKSLYLIRHAKSSWDSVALDDFDRPLNERGKNDAPQMARRLRKKIKSIDLILTSPAKRARKTAEIFAREFDVGDKKVRHIPGLYMGGPADFAECIRALKNKYDSVAIFAHNPGISEFAGGLTEARVDDMPTCSVFAIEIDTDSWSDFDKAKKTFLFFDYPRSQPSS